MRHALPFAIAEYEGRLDRTRRAMQDANLDLLLLFHQESLYYLFGYDQIGYWVYQKSWRTSLRRFAEPRPVVRE